MRPAAELSRRHVLALAGVVLLAGCATARAPRPAIPAQDQAAMPAEEQAAWLAGLSRFGIDGRAAVVAGSDGFNPGFNWRQAGALSSVQLSGPLGVGSLTVEYAPDSLRVFTSRGEELRDATAEAAITRELGFMPPFESLRYWMLGLPAPGDVVTDEIFDEAGRIVERRQHAWHVRYERWMDHATPGGTVRLPQRLTATRDALRLRVFVDRWQLH